MLEVLILISVVLVFGLVILYNGKILAFLAEAGKRSENFFLRFVGVHMQKLGDRTEQSVNLQKGSLRYKFNVYVKDIIANMGMSKDHVTPVGFLTFVGSLSVILSILFGVIVQDFILFIPALIIFFYLILIIFRFVSLTRYEKNEAEIMDTIDLLAMDIKGGVYNAIVRYKDSFHPNIKPHFDEFITNIRRGGYSFRDAMLLLNERLGSNFTDFAQKTIYYEEKADKDMDDIFSAIIEVNRYKRELRYQNNEKFSSLRMEFLISVAIIILYGIFSFFTDPYISNFFRTTFLGKLFLLTDFFIVAVVLSYIASIKAKFL